MKKWVWMPHSGHLIVGRDCRFHLATRIGKYLVSTVGEWLPDEPVREIISKSRGIKLEGMGDARLNSFLRQNGYEEIGAGRKYETMVFHAKKSNERCCPWVMASAMEIDSSGGYNDPGDAYEGHLKMCKKWDSK